MCEDAGVDFGEAPEHCSSGCRAVNKPPTLHVVIL